MPHSRQHRHAVLFAERTRDVRTITTTTARFGPCSFPPMIWDLPPNERVCRPEHLQAYSSNLYVAGSL